MRRFVSTRNLRSPGCYRVRWFSRSLTHHNKSNTSSHLASEKQDATVRRKDSSHSRQRIFSGIQPTGIPHLGNYLGALQRWKELQDQATRDKDPKNFQLLFSIVDLHALTGAQDREALLKSRKESYASLLAIGLDPKHSILFMQSAVPAHTQLLWLLMTVAPIGYLSRMTQWKSKLDLPEDVSMNDMANSDKLRLGLFSYPVLQAADIMLYQPDWVPVGEDQAQHIEFTRNIARRFNFQHGSKDRGLAFAKEPQLMLSPAKRIMSLKKPTEKMSKSSPIAASRILITDDEETIRKRINGALTDTIEGISYDVATRPGWSNLIDILRSVKYPKATFEEIAADNANVERGAFKKHVADSVIEALAGIRERYLEVMDPKNPAMAEALYLGETKATAIANQSMTKLYKYLGLADVVPRPTRNQKAHVTQSYSRNNTQETSSTPSLPIESLSKEQIQEEQQQEELGAQDEPQVLPQQRQGVDQTIAS